MPPGTQTPLTLVTAADEKYGRCLWQLLNDVERRDLPGEVRMVAGDLGMARSTRQRLETRFPWCGFLDFDFSAYPAHVLKLKNYAWKPILIEQVFASSRGDLLWLDSATLLHAPLAEFRRELSLRGLYTLHGQTLIKESTDPRTLDLLKVPPALADAQIVVSGLVGFARGSTVAKEVLAEWKALALRPEVIAPVEPRPAGHRFEQALLSILVQRKAQLGELSVNPGSIDISSANPVRWMSSRNKVGPRVPRCLDWAIRLYYRTWKFFDRQVIRLKRFKATRLDGLHRRPREAYRVYVRTASGTRTKSVEAPPGSYLADPFLCRHAGEDWIFAEQFRYRHNSGRLVAFPLRPDGTAGTLEPLSLAGAAEVHRSFPYIFETGGALCLVPETSANRCVDLFVCENYPNRWRLHRRLLDRVDAADSVVFPNGGLWWIITSLRRPGSSGRSLAVYFSDDLVDGIWTAHPVNARDLYLSDPFYTGRCAGPPLRLEGGEIVRPMQVNRRYYGEAVELMRIDILTPDHYAESPRRGDHPLQKLTTSGNTHHLSASGDWIAYDVRTRVSYGQHLPLWRRPSPRIPPP